VRGEVFRLLAPRGTRGHQQSRLPLRRRSPVRSTAVDLGRRTTATSARGASFRPEVEIGGINIRLLAEQAAAVDPSRLGKSVGLLSFDEMRRVDAALRIVLDL
jgi:mRNA interferase MazF